MAGKPRLALLPSYLKAIENSVGTKLFRNLYYYINGKPLDVLDDGDLACATYVTSILYLFDLIAERHTTVIATIDDIEKAGWYEIKRPKKGALILWGFKKKDDGTQGKHRHIGFYINPKTAISNFAPKRKVLRHHLTFGKMKNGEVRREVLAYYWHKKLN